MLVVAAITTQPFMYIDTDHPESALFIHWRGGTGTVHYGITDYNQSLTGDNEVHLTGLVGHARYQWFLVVDGDTGELGSFQLDPGVGGAFKIALFGDTQMMDSAVVRFFEYAHTHQPDLIAVLGDLLTMDNAGCVGCNSFERFFNFYPALFANAILVPVKGNHDDSMAYWTARFPHIPATVYTDNVNVTAEHQLGHNYFMDYGNVTFCINDGNQTAGLGEWTHSLLKSWWTAKLDARIAAQTLRPIVVVFSHYPREGAGSSYFGPVYQTRHGVLFYNGHTHYYKRTKWLQMGNTYGSGVTGVSDTQVAGHMVYCHAGQAAGTDDCTPDSNTVYSNCSGDADAARMMSLVEFAGGGMIHHKAYKVLNTQGRYDGDHGIRDTFSVNCTEWVSGATGTNVRTSMPNKGPLLTASPNPFSSEVRFSIAGPAGMAAGDLRIYDLRGRLLESLSIPTEPEGAVVWNARTLPAGVYLARLRVSGREQTRLVFLRQ